MLFQNLNNFQQASKTAVTIMSGMFGGLGRAMAFSTLKITLSHTLEVCLYAALSAIIGYLIKSLLDRINRYLRKRFGTPSNPDTHE